MTLTLSDSHIDEFFFILFSFDQVVPCVNLFFNHYTFVLNIYWKRCEMRKERLYKLTSYLEGRISYKEKMVRDFEIVMNRHGKCIAKKKKSRKVTRRKDKWKHWLCSWCSQWWWGRSSYTCGHLTSFITITVLIYVAHAFSSMAKGREVSFLKFLGD